MVFRARPLALSPKWKKFAKVMDPWQRWRRPAGRPHPATLSGIILLLVIALLVACGQAAGVGSELSASATPLPTAMKTATRPTATRTQLPPTKTATSRPTLTPPPVTVDHTPTPTAEPPRPLFESPEYGIHLSQWWHLDALQQDLALAQQMGFGWIKQKFPWRDIEKAKGEFDWYRPDEIVAAVEAAELKLLVRLDVHPLWSVLSLPDEQITPNQPPVDFQDFGDFCHALAERYRGRIGAYQVWNEPNLSREWGNRSPDPQEYTELLRVCYEGIKRADPGAIVISAGLAPTGDQPPRAMPDADFLQGMYDAGAAAYFDVLGLNAPGYKAPPEADPEEGITVPGYGGHRWNVFRHVEDMREIMVRNGDEDKQVAILEMGWVLSQDIHADYTWHGVSEQEQADYLVRAYRYARQHWQPWIGLMTTIYIADFDWTPEANEQYWWSIVLPDGTPRLAFQALAEMDK